MTRTENNNKRKRGRDSAAAASNNPLAVARATSSSSSKKSKSDKAETLWHKRSGIGYRLFVEYYRQQPAGVVIPAILPASRNAINNQTHNNNNDHCNDTTRTSESKQTTTRATVSKTATPVAAAAAASVAASSGRGSGAGQSRASKKRQKKRQGQQHQQQHQQSSGGSPETDLAAFAFSTTSTTTACPAAQEHYDASTLETCIAAATTTTLSSIQQREKAQRQQRTISDNNKNDRHPLLEALVLQNKRRHHHVHHQNPNNHDDDDDDDAFEEFLVALSKPLPLSFRIRNGISSSVRQELTLHIQEHFSQLVAPVPWGGAADDAQRIYQAKPLLSRSTTTTTTTTTPSSTSSKIATSTSTNINNNSVLSKSNLSHVSPALKQFLQQHSVDGTLARQEVGSMLPVLGLHRGGWLSTTATTSNVDSSSSSSSSTSSIRSLRILDMCASPGSKTLQVVELLQLQQQQQQSISRNNAKQPRIVIRANDVNATRLETLRQAVERSNVLQAPSASTTQQQNNDGSGRKCGSSIIIKYTNFDASQYPIPPAVSSSKKAYNLILCDVPCSGDGTIRKDGHILPTWTPATSHALHQLQVNILYRALSCLQTNGSSVVSYSTCSLNPIENEAVVAAAILKARQTVLRQQGGRRGRHDAAEVVEKKGSPQRRPIVELVDWPEMPSSGFIRRPGVCGWKVADYVGHAVDEDDDQDLEDTRDGDQKDKMDQRRRKGSSTRTGLLRWHATYQDAVQAQMEHAVPTMWPPPPPPSLAASTCEKMETKNGNGCETNEEEEEPLLHLERCIRLLPQDHDTGGFFVALIRRNF
jgi:16S rRNA C967 or C1407 C5-methylase (RsmB/RsmF family)